MKLLNMCFFMEEYIVKILFFPQWAGDEDPGKQGENLVIFSIGHTLFIVGTEPCKVPF